MTVAQGLINHQVKLAARPAGLPKRSDWEFAEAPVDEPAEGKVLVKIMYISLDPAMRGWMNKARSYIPPVRIGQVMRAGAAGQVVASNHPDFKEGDYVTGTLGVQEYAEAKGEELVKVDTSLAELQTYLGILGMPGMTAYFGLLDTGLPQAGENLVVSGAAGAVGAVVGQIAKLKGCNVLGIAGGKEKCDYLINELGFDGAVDYKSEDVFKGVKKFFKDGVDIYFDNVGGDMLEALLMNIRRKARIVICGAISQYNNSDEVKGPRNYLQLLVHRARMEGIVVFDNHERFPEAAKEMAGWLKEGKLTAKEHIEEGLENFPEVLNKLFTGGNFGKLVLKV